MIVVTEPNLWRRLPFKVYMIKEAIEHKKSQLTVDEFIENITWRLPTVQVYSVGNHLFIRDSSDGSWSWYPRWRFS